MTLRCRPGDLAIIGGSSEVGGKMVEILYLVPSGVFDLPDGFSHVPCDPDWWVVKFLSGTINAPVCIDGKKIRDRRTLFAPAPDKKLWPIRPDELKSKERERETV